LYLFNISPFNWVLLRLFPRNNFKIQLIKMFNSVIFFNFSLNCCNLIKKIPRGYSWQLQLSWIRSEASFSFILLTMMLMLMVADLILILCNIHQLELKVQKNIKYQSCPQTFWHFDILTYLMWNDKDLKLDVVVVMHYQITS
jgi:hypothetical protein